MNATAQQNLLDSLKSLNAAFAAILRIHQKRKGPTMTPRTAAEMLADEPDLYREDPPDLESGTQTVLARDLRVGDVLVSAALGGVWGTSIERIRPMGLEVFIDLADRALVVLERNEVCQVRR